MSAGPRLFLRPGESVTHRDYPEWGRGSVLEISTSTIPGGAAYVRISFEDGQERTFFNDLDDSRCAYFMGLKRIDMREGDFPFPW
ncbi:DUF3553 domain-containing protein [Leptospirillum ferriphilum]|jgi:hypothetical protein|uniref:DUF3553 domain-containing protein n=2 Tax=Leptospirillum TaxID=179 RepID=A0A094WHQ6_9BACT|nr:MULTISPECIES: DUF3553 domain-containing protein [Leptospirillum]AKS22911.1 hypothetical protein ABH19_02815 [Leptospirillum sp. Group II 'CF-1']EDZ39392.1 MAG: Hypothetical protein CGL2_11277027 [Leptospirillum sp. Group II '5-way CG']EIJ76601.1 MAG: Hypothetical protein C75L2_00010032 [Leptospirillum sp. Group II 'C75']KGA95222.1 hypothetical protein LptCag_2656 [Leptospirillum ferriphilum]